MYSDESKLANGRVGGGWYGNGWAGSTPSGAVSVGETSTVWDGEISGMLGAIANFDKGERILLLADSKAAISAVKKAGIKGKARTADLKQLIELIEERGQGLEESGAVAVGWVKSHAGIKGNEMADRQARKGAGMKTQGGQVTEGGIRQKVKECRREAGQAIGYGKGKVMSWGRCTYTQLRTNRGALRACKFKIGKDDSPQCRHCGEGDETGDHLMFACKKWKKLRRKV